MILSLEIKHEDYDYYCIGAIEINYNLDSQDFKNFQKYLVKLYKRYALLKNKKKYPTFIDYLFAYPKDFSFATADLSTYPIVLG